MKMGEIRGMKEDALEKKLAEFRLELVTGQNLKAKSIKLSMARIIARLAELKRAQAAAAAPAPKASAKPAAAKAKAPAQKK